MEKFLQGQQSIFAKSDNLRDVVKKIWPKLQKNRQITLPDGDYILYNELFLNCVKLKAKKKILECEKLRLNLGDSWNSWLLALQQSCNIVISNNLSTKEEIFQRLCFEIPQIDWREFRNDLRSETNINILKDAYLVVQYLENSTMPIAPADLGVQLFKDSKHLKNTAIQNWSCKFLRQRNLITENCSDKELLEKFGLTANATASTVTVYGPFLYQTTKAKHDWINTLYTLNESAILSWDNIKDITNVQVKKPVLCIENESVFNRLKEQKTDYALVYTAGFPGRAVRQWIAKLDKSVPLFHWGDSDPEGFEIATILHKIHSLKLLNCDCASLETQKQHTIPLSLAKRKRAERLLKNSSCPFKAELEWIIANNCWLEQESFCTLV